MKKTNAIFSEFGLDTSMQQIFETLLTSGDLSISELITKTALSRATVSSAVKQLRTRGIITEQRIGRVAKISLAHPKQLEQIIAQKQQETAESIDRLQSYIRESTNAYNLSHHGPGVRFFEGETEITELLADSLKATDEILTITDHDAVERYAKAINEEYVAARLQSGIRKRMLLPHSKAAREYAESVQSDLTDIRFISSQFKTSLATEIYNDTVSTIVANETQIYGWLITQPIYARFQKQLFEELWAKATLPVR